MGKTGPAKRRLGSLALVFAVVLSLIGALALPVHAEGAAALDLRGKGLCSDEAAFAGAQSKLELQYNSTNQTTTVVSLSLDMVLDSPYLNGLFVAASDNAALGIT